MASCDVLLKRWIKLKDLCYIYLMCRNPFNSTTTKKVLQNNCLPYANIIDFLRPRLKV